jgi:Tol biopolymer transport system component
VQLVRKSVENGQEVVVSSNAGTLADSTVTQPSITADGSKVAFASFASSLTPGLGQQILLWTEGSSELEIVSRNDQGDPGFAATFQDSPSISADGRYVAFRSRAINFPGGRDAVPSYPQVYVRDRVAGRLSLISRTASGSGALLGSSDGNCEQAGPGALFCSLRISPRITADGRAVFFHSSSDDLFPANPRSLQAFRFDYARLVGGDFARPVPIGTVALVALLVLMLGIGVVRSRVSA